MNTTTRSWKKPVTGHDNFSSATKQDRSTRKVVPRKHEEIPLDDLNASSMGTVRSLLKDRKAMNPTPVSINQWEMKSSSHQALCTTRAAIITFIIILSIILIAAIAVGVIFGVLGSQLYGSRSNTTNQNSFTTVVVSGVTSIVSVGSQIGAACSAYTTIDDPTRNANRTGMISTCDNGPLFNTSRGGAWIRFVGTGGTTIPLTSPGVNHCGAFLAGWFNGSLPTSSYPEMNTTVCFETYADECGYEVDVSAVYCSGGFYVYFLPPLVICNSRYCTE